MDSSRKTSDEYIKTIVTKRRAVTWGVKDGSPEPPRALNAATKHDTSQSSDTFLSHTLDENNLVANNVYTGAGHPTGTPDTSPPGPDLTAEPSGLSISSESDHCDEDIYIYVRNVIMYIMMARISTRTRTMMTNPSPYV